MTNNEILSLMVENATGADSDKALNNALKIVDYVNKHPDDFATGYARKFIAACIIESYADMMTVISDFAKYLASERRIIEDFNWGGETRLSSLYYLSWNTFDNLDRINLDSI